jgi:NDP-sugar pyrophosphorylase family protein
MHQTGKFSIVDVYLSLAKNHVIKSYDHSGELLMDVGKPESILEAEKYF